MLPLALPATGVRVVLPTNVVPVDWVMPMLVHHTMVAEAVATLRVGLISHPLPPFADGRLSGSSSSSDGM